jgi:aromatic ring-opening dioxygenase LigB subunit
MIIMQTEDANKRREYIEEKGLGKVIFRHEHGDVTCVQYHPKGIKGRLAAHGFDSAAPLTFVHRRRYDARA